MYIYIYMRPIGSSTCCSRSCACPTGIHTLPPHGIIPPSCCRSAQNTREKLL